MQNEDFNIANISIESSPNSSIRPSTRLELLLELLSYKQQKKSIYSFFKGSIK